MSTLRVVGPDQLIIFAQDSTLHSQQVGNWIVHEELDPPGTENGKPELRRYRIVMQCAKVPAGRLEALFQEAVAISERLERLWLYVATYPMSGRRFVAFLEPLRLRTGWTDNLEQVREELVRKEGVHIGRIHINNRSWISPPWLPLQNALIALSNLDKLPSSYQALTELHYEAHVAVGRFSAELGFARALELVRAMLPGRTDNDREKGLAPEVRNVLTRSLRWLFELSNTRLSTRHVVASTSNPELLPRMTFEEHRDFVYNSDSVLRGIISSELNIPFLAVRDGRRPMSQ